TYVMTASYAGDTGFLPSASAPVTFTIPKAGMNSFLTSIDSSTTYTAGSPVHVRVQESYTVYIGRPSAPGGTVAIVDGTTTLVTIPVSDASLTNDITLTNLGVGTHIL